MRTVSFDAGAFAPARPIDVDRSSRWVPHLGSRIPAPADGAARHQATLSRDIAVAGRGLHTGKRSNVRLRPAPCGSGIVFRRIRNGEALEIPANWEKQVRQPLCTALRHAGGPLVRTVEHLLATLVAFGVDNVLVEIDAEELPIFDGSAVRWCEALRQAGLRDQGELRRRIRVLKPVEYRTGTSVLRIEPAREFSLDVQIALHRFGRMRWRGAVTPSVFSDQLAPARSFGRPKWALAAQLGGYLTGSPILRGAHPGSVAVLWGGRILGGMRVPDEPVRHRALDLIGDLALAGAPLLGHVSAVDPGHDKNLGLLARLMSDRDAWVLEPDPDPT